MKPKNFREYLMQKIKQTRIDQKDTIKDAKKRNDKEQLKLQNEFYSGRLFTLKEIYEESKEYEWKRRI